VLLTPRISKLKISKYFIILFLLFIISFIFLYLTNFYFKSNLGPIASSSSGIYSNPLNIVLTNFIPHSEIKYSLDNSKPNLSSPSYKNPFEINSSTVLRVQAFRDKEPIGNEKIYSYIFHQRNINLPIVNLIINNYDLYDKKKGIYTNPKKLSWYRNAKFEFYEKDSLSPAISLDGEARIYGSRSRDFPRKSFYICFDNKNINYKIFTDNQNLSYDCLIIRNSGNDFNHTFIRDSLIHNFAKENTNLYFQDSKHIILYLNNQYFGIYDLREANNPNTLSLKFGGDADDYAILYQFDGNKGEVRKDAGTKTDINLFKELLEIVTKDTDNPEIISRIEDLMDIDNYFEYQILQTYFRNYDYIYQNFKIFRYNGFIKEPGTFRDGKLRWLLYDTDVSLGFSIREKDIFYTLTGKAEKDGRTWSYVLYNNLMKSKYFREKFLIKYSDYLNSKLLSENVNSYIDKYQTLIEPEVPYHIKRWENFILGQGEKPEYEIPLKTKSEWDYNIHEMKDFVSSRRLNIYKELDANFSLGGTYNLKIVNESPLNGYVRVNSLIINKDSWSGIYFNNLNISYEAIPLPGYKFVGWEVDTKFLKKPIFRKL
jgi:hypothetical protein